MFVSVRGDSSLMRRCVVWTGKQPKNKAAVRSGVLKLCQKSMGHLKIPRRDKETFEVPSILRIHTCQVTVNKIYFCIPVLEPEE